MLEYIQTLLQLDVLINNLAVTLGLWLFVLLFFVIFAETGLIIAPFLPGDSLLFAVGALSASSPYFDIKVLVPLLIAASIAGDSTNYYVGRNYGRKLFSSRHFLSRLFNVEYLRRTEEFYRKRGDVAVAIARFLPIVRTVAPFVGGLTKMPYPRFLTLSALGSVAWVCIFCLAGFFFGQIPFIRENFTLLVMGIIAFSLAPLILSLLKQVFLKTEKTPV